MRTLHSSPRASGSSPRGSTVWHIAHACADSVQRQTAMPMVMSKPSTTRLFISIINSIKVDEAKQQDPQAANEIPVPGAHFDSNETVRRKSSPTCEPDNDE
jgi:hypothetical protein